MGTLSYVSTPKDPKHVPLSALVIVVILFCGLGGLGGVGVVLGQQEDVFLLIGWPMLVIGGIFLQVAVIAAGVEMGVRNARR